MTSTNYEIQGTIGEGAHGIVLKGRHLRTSSPVALKKVALKKISTEGLPVQVIREIKALQYLKRHDNVVYLRDMFPQGQSMVLVFQYLPSNLWEILNSNKLIASHIKCYMTMLLSGVGFIHSNKIIHRDLKPANLLISDEGILKIGDFGLCRVHFKDERRAYSHQVATRWYRSPELLYGARYYDEGVDLWAVGCIFAEMLKGEPLFPGENDIDQLYKVISSLGSPDEDSWPGCMALPDYNKICFSQMRPIPLNVLVQTDVPLAVEFLSKFLNYDSSKRLSAHDGLNHEFFRKLPGPCLPSELPSIPSKSNSTNGELDDFDESPSSSSALYHHPMNSSFQEIFPISFSSTASDIS